VEDHIDEEDISPGNMGAAQARPDPEDFLGDDANDEEVAPWMKNPVVVSNIDDNTLQKFIDDNDRVFLFFVDSTYNFIIVIIDLRYRLDVNAEAELLEQIGVLSQQYGDRIAFGKVEAKNAPKMLEYFNIKELPAAKYFRYNITRKVIYIFRR